jgi:excisionase family DNA binding protein
MFLRGMNMAQNEYMNVKEAADYLRIAVPTLYQWVYSKKITYRKHGRLLAFHKTDLDNWSNSTVVKSQSNSQVEQEAVC